MKKMLLLAAGMILLSLLAGCATNSYPMETDEMEAICNIDDSYMYCIRTYSDPKNLTGRFISKESEKPDIEIYAEAKKDKTLEEFGQAQAAKHNVFCNTMGETKVLNYYRGGKFVQDYIAERNNVFFTFSYVYDVEKYYVSGSDMTFLLPVGYDGTPDAQTAFDYECDYKISGDSFPDISVRRVSKNGFGPEKYDAGVFQKTTKEKYDSFAENGWTMEEWLSLYAENHELVRGEMMQRSGLDMAFIAFVEDGVFNVRAVIDDADGYVFLCASDSAENFQHVTNAIIDTISSENR